MRATLLAAAICLAPACAPDLRDDYPFDGELPAGTYVTHEELGDGLTRTTVDATHKEAWVYYDFDTRQEVSAGDAAGTLDWDLAFQRFKIISNGGVSGAGSVAVAVLQGGDFESLTRAPADGYLTDEADGPDDNSDVDSAFLAGDGWYSYNLLQHKVLPRPELLYVVRTSQAKYFALKLVAYYDAAGSGAKPSFDWKWLSAP